MKSNQYSLLNLSNDVFETFILWNLTPIDSCNLRKTCSTINTLVKKSNIYWFYNYKKNTNPSFGTKSVHTVEFTPECISRIYEELETYLIYLSTIYPDNEEIKQYIGINYYVDHKRHICQKYILALENKIKCCNKTHFMNENTINTFENIDKTGIDLILGLWIYHYLFERYKTTSKHFHKLQAKKNIKKDYSITKNKYLIAKANFEKIERELYIYENYEKINNNIKSSLFARRNPEQYSLKDKQIHDNKLKKNKYIFLS